MDANEIFDESKLQVGPDDFDPAADLDGLMVQSAHNPGYRPEFMRRLLVSPLWLLVEEEPDLAEAVGGYVGFAPLQLPDGCIPVFTSVARMQDHPAVAERPRTSVKGRDLLEALQGKNLVLNLFSEASLELPAEFCRRMLAGEDMSCSQEVLLDSEVDMEIADPDEYPHEMVASVRVVLSSQPRVAAAYLVYVRASTQGGPHFIISLDVEGEFKSIAQEVGIVTRGFMRKPGDKVAVQQLLRDDEGTFTDYLLSTTPIYLRT